MTRDNGGSAFPRTIYNPDTDAPFGQSPGITIRDYFAAHAPSEPASWFVPRVDKRPHWSAKNNRKLPHGNSASVGHCDECIAYFEESDRLDREKDKADSEYMMAKCVEWPYAWADAMLAERTK